MGALDIQDALADNLENMVGSYQEQMAAPPDAGAGVGAGVSNNGGNGGNGGEAGAGRMPQAGPSTDNNADRGPSLLPRLPSYIMEPFASSPSYEKRKTVIGYYAMIFGSPHWEEW